MKKILGFICAILITVFAIMPNAYAEVQKDYANLDMNRWVFVAPFNDRDILIDKTSFDYKLEYKDKLLCNLWVCYFFNNEDQYTFHNITIDYNNKALSLDSYITYNKKGEVLDSYTLPYQDFKKVVPGSVGELYYYIAFHPDYVDEIKKQLKKEG